MNDTHDAPAPPQDQAVERTISRFKWVGWSSLFFAVVQSVCTLFVALSGLQLLLSAAAFSAAIAAMHVVGKNPRGRHPHPNGDIRSGRSGV